MKLFKLKLLVLAACLLAASSAFASLSYNVSVDTSSLTGNDGYLYFQFAPGNFAQDASVTISGFSVLDGSLSAEAPVLNGGASGLLPGISIANSSGLNDYTQGIHFGTSFAFNLLLDGPAVNAPNGTALGGSSFLLALSRNADGSAPLLSGDGTLLTLDLATDGTALANTAAPQVAASQAAQTPIPAAAWLLGSGLMGLVGLRRRKQQ
jgi:hypothetical protein